MGTAMRQLHLHLHQQLQIQQSALIGFVNPISSPFLPPNNRFLGSRSTPNFTENPTTSPESRRRRRRVISASSSGNAAAVVWDDWKPDRASKPPSLSDVVWPSAGAFLAMAALGKMDQLLAAKGVSMTIAPFGAVSAVLFATPSSPGARKYNMFLAQMGCAAIGVLAFTVFGPGWLARSCGLAAAIAFMIYTHSVHPPAASLPLLFIDGAKFHHLKFWYALFPGAAGCILLCLIQEMVSYLKDNITF